jgi:methyl-accepting chemotaxis protein
VDSFIKDGFNEINEKIHKLNEVTNKVSDGLHEVTNQVTQNLHSGFDKLHEEIKPVTDLGDIKDSINNLKSLYAQQSSKIVDITPPSTPVAMMSTPVLDTSSAMSNAEEVLSRLNSMKIIGNNNSNKQA